MRRTARHLPARAEIRTRNIDSAADNNFLLFNINNLANCSRSKTTGMDTALRLIPNFLGTA
jgi:hypothetical protein